MNIFPCVFVKGCLLDWILYEIMVVKLSCRNEISQRLLGHFLGVSVSSANVSDDYEDKHTYTSTCVRILNFLGKGYRPGNPMIGLFSVGETRSLWKN